MTGDGGSQRVEAVQRELLELGRERERLHASGAGREDLERNRGAIVRANQALARALIARNTPGLQPA